MSDTILENCHVCGKESACIEGICSECDSHPIEWGQLRKLQKEYNQLLNIAKAGAIESWSLKKQLLVYGHHLHGCPYYYNRTCSCGWLGISSKLKETLNEITTREQNSSSTPETNPPTETSPEKL